MIQFNQPHKPCKSQCKMNIKKSLVLCYLLALGIRLLSQPLAFTIVVNQNQPVLLDRDIEIKYYIINKSKRLVQVPEPNLCQLFFFIKSVKDTAWLMVNRNILDGHTYSDVAIPAKDSIWLLEELNSGCGWLEPGSHYQLRAVYCKKKWIYRDRNSMHPEKLKCKPVFGEAEFTTETLDLHDEELYNLIRQEHFGGYFLAQYPADVKDEHKKRVTELIAQFPASRFCLNAKFAFLETIRFAKLHPTGQRIPEEDFVLAKQYGLDILRSPSPTFRIKERVRSIMQELGWDK